MVGVHTTGLISFHLITKCIVIRFCLLIYTGVAGILVMIYWLFL